MAAVIVLQQFQAGMVAQDGFELAGQVGCLAQTQVHAVHAGGAGLMGGVARQPAAALAEAQRQLALELDLGDPEDVLDIELEPGCALGQKTAQGEETSA